MNESIYVFAQSFQTAVVLVGGGRGRASKQNFSGFDFAKKPLVIPERKKKLSTSSTVNRSTT